MREYVVWRPDWGQGKEDGRHIDAHSSRAACERWAAQEDAESADYLIVRGNPVTLVVAIAAEGAEEQTFVVTGEAVPEYRAALVVTPATKGQDE